MENNEQNHEQHERYPWDGSERRAVPAPTVINTYNIKDLVSTAILSMTALVAIISAYYNLNNTVEKNKIESTIYKDLTITEIKEIKESMLILKIEVSKISDANDEQINQIKEQLMAIDNSITQIYQRISKKP